MHRTTLFRERCCSSAITRERNLLVRRDSLLREQLSVRTAPQLSRAAARVVRLQRDFLPAIEARPLTSMSEARPFACKLGTPCALVVADGGDHLPLCRYNAAFCADLGRHIDDRPKSRAAWRRLVLLRMQRCLPFRLRAMAERKVLSALFDDYAFTPLPSCGAFLT